MQVLSKERLSYVIAAIKTKFVAKESGKGLSTNDYTTADKDKLGKIAEGAQVNVIEKVNVNGTALTATGKEVNIDLTPYAKKTDISDVYKYKGSKKTYAELPATGQAVGDVYNVETADPAHDILAGDNVAWDGTKWDKLGGTFTIDTSGFATKTELNNKVDKVSGKGLSANDFTNDLKTKLEGLSNYTHPTTDGNKHIPANGTNNAGKVLTATAAAGVYEWKNAVEEITEAEIDAMFGA